MLRPTLLMVMLFALVIPAQSDARRISESDIRGHIEILASDEYEGRDPGTTGEDKTITYIAEQWAKAGLTPGGKDGGWFQKVPLVSYTPDESSVRFRRGRRNLRFSKDDIILLGKDAEYEKKSVPVFFAGYGVKPDGQLIDDVAGKAVLLYFETGSSGNAELRSPRTVGRALAKAGAEAVIFVSSIDNWDRAKNAFQSPSLTLEGQYSRAPLQGIVSTEFAVGLVTSGGDDWDMLREKAKADDFAGIDLRVVADFNVKSKVRAFESSNVIGKISGRKPENGAIMYMGHWDHLGLCGSDEDEDKICNGAVDNASGISVLIEVAEKLARKKHDRDIYFLATTAEERGLLGAYGYVRDPVFPLDDIAIALNVDTIAIAPRGSKVAIIGDRSKAFDKTIADFARKQRRKLEKSDDANAFLMRQDGWAFAQEGVPAYMIGGSFADQKLLRKFLGGPYHGVDDELNDNTELGGATEDANLHVRMGRYFANARKFSKNELRKTDEEKAEESSSKK